MERALRKATERLGYKEMKPEQEELVKEFISGRDVFGILPTGFGKSLCNGCLPWPLQIILNLNSIKGSLGVAYS